jgi:diguanylate cyclase (GGDEF)-like protein/PAS domain S-box-containing protein
MRARPQGPEDDGHEAPQSFQYEKEWALLFVVWALAAVAVAYMLLKSRDSILSQEQAHLLTQTRVIEDNLVRQLEGANNAMVGVRYDVTSADHDEDAPQFPLRLKLLTDAMPGVRTMQVLDALGVCTASSRPELEGRSFKERDYFVNVLKHRDDTRLYVSPPFKSVLGPVVVALSRSMTGMDGKFAGVVTATLDPEYFEIVLRSALYTPDTHATLIHADGHVVVTAPRGEDEGTINLNAPGTMYRHHVDGRQASSVFEGNVVGTGENRLVALRTIHPPAFNMDQPFIVSVSRAYEAVLAPWYAEIRADIIAMALLAAAASVWLSFNQRKRIAAARAALALATVERESARRFEFGLKGADLGLWEWSLAADALVVNEREWQMLGYPQQATPLKAADWMRLIHPDDAAAVQAAYDAHVRGDAPTYRVEHRMRHRDGGWIWVLDHAMVMERDADGKPLRLVGTHLDITARVQAEQEMKRMNAQLEALSLTDGLTGVGNRRRFDQTLGSEWMRAQRQQEPLAILMIDVDHFKRYNDHYGHQAGDECLRQVAQAVSSSLRQPLEQVMRYGGEEFAVLLMAADATGGAVVAQRCLDAVVRARIPHEASPVGPMVSISIGVASMVPHSNNSAEQLLHCADQALYQAKQAGRARFMVANTVTDRPSATTASQANDTAA